MTTYAIVGSTSLPLEKASGHILRLMMPLIPGQDRVLVRGRKTENPGDKPIPLAGPDAMVAAFAAVLHLDLEVEPLPPEGTKSDFARARNMAVKADEVWAIFNGDTHIGGSSHVMFCGINQNKPTRAYDYLEEDGQIRLSAEWDPEGKVTILPDSPRIFRATLNESPVVVMNGDSLSVKFTYNV